jgi:hypothetical protein
MKNGFNSTNALSKREWLAGLAMQAIILKGVNNLDDAAKEATEYADALILQLCKTEQDEAYITEED